MKKLFALCMALMLAILSMGVAMAEAITIYGTVINTQPQSVVCMTEGTIEQVHVTVGDRVAAGDDMATIAANKVYAVAEGTVYLFGEVGDLISDITAQYGAVAYIAPAHPYTVTAAATDANGLAVRVIPGEHVYLRCYKDGKHKGEGILAKLEGDKYTVVVTEGEFAQNETISIYRDEKYTEVSRIGRGKVSTADLIACKGDGHLVKLHVRNGESVPKGTLLYESISGPFAPGITQYDKVVAPVDGVVSAVYEHAGSQLTGIQVTDASALTLSAAHVIAEVYPDAGLRVKAYAPESVLNDIHENDTVYISCPYIENMAEAVVGVVEKISRIPSPESSGVEAQYAVYVTVFDTGSFYYGMNVTVSTSETVNFAEYIFNGQR